MCNCAAYSQRALQVGDPFSGFTRSREQWFNTAAFAQPPSGRFGKSGHNILGGPTAKDSVVLRVPHHPHSGKVRLQFRSEFFNLLNYPNFGEPGATVRTTNFSVSTSAADARIIQFALKIEFLKLRPKDDAAARGLQHTQDTGRSEYMRAFSQLK